MSLRQDVRIAMVRAALDAWWEAVRVSRPSVLDLGCQSGLLGHLVREMFDKCDLTGVDAWPPHTARKCGPYGRLVCADALDFLRTAQPSDVVLACEIVEHFERERGAEFLAAVRACARLAIVTAPLGEMPQGAIDGNPHEVHRSAWTPENMTAAGYEVYGIVPALHLGVYVHRKDPVAWRA